MIINEYTTSQRPAIELLQKLGYKYISPADAEKQRGNKYNVLLHDILRAQLKKLNCFKFANNSYEFSQSNIEKAIEDLNIPATEGLITANEKIYHTLMLGNAYPEIVGDGKTLNFNLKYIDWENFGNNVLHVTEEFQTESLDKRHNARPDIVLFINGIPFCVIECKDSITPIDQAIEQNIRNQKHDYIPQLFKFIQLIIATKSIKTMYATVGSPKKYWYSWKEEDTAFLNGELDKLISGRMATEQDETLISLLHPVRIYELIKYFILFDSKEKKICRYQQYFAVKNTVQTITQINNENTRQGGTIWHTQGSGKSLTMAMLAKYILIEMKIKEPRVIIVTDRVELDKQIFETFANTDLKPARATSGAKLVELINDSESQIITTIINKFETAENYKAVNLSNNIFVIVDESHRTNYGQLATKMRTVFPNACYIGFTGTPLLKSEKNTITKFGNKLIHKYTIKDGVEDKIIVPLIYEGKFVQQDVDKQNIDIWFDKFTQNHTPQQKEFLKKKWSSIQKLNSSDARISHIALDINEHFIANYKDTGFKAMLATNFKKDAVNYLEAFESFGDLECAVVISSPDMREGSEDIHDEVNDKVYKFWDKMIAKYGSPQAYEETVISKFKNGEIDILIVCSKLLTGFDAPVCQVIYIDKELQDHNLLQAIARCNRINEGKEYGLIVDYRGLIQKLDSAMSVYSGGGLENFDEADLSGVAKDIMETIGDVRECHSKIKDFFTSIKNKQDIAEHTAMLDTKEKREEFYKLMREFGNQLTIANSTQKVYEAIRDDIKIYNIDFTFWTRVRRQTQIIYQEIVEKDKYEEVMQNLLNKHLHVIDLKPLTAPVSLFHQDEFQKELERLVGERSKAEMIADKITKSISEKHDENPAYYDLFSERIKDALEKFKDKVLTDSEYLLKMTEIMADYVNHKSVKYYPDKLENNIHAQAFYGVIYGILKDDIDRNIQADIALSITTIIEKHNQVDWTSNSTIHARIAQDIDSMFYENRDKITLPLETIDKIIENVKTVALRRF